MKGLIFSIKRYAIHDGPGIRVTFFLKGCPLSCWWCHNPEGISPQASSVERIDRVGDREFKSMETVGMEYSPEDLLAIAEKERVFIEQSGGGVTFSGGEPTQQFDFLLESLKLMRNAGISTAVDTSGYLSKERLEKLIPYTDTFLFDLKHLDPAEHRKYTGVDNVLILNNLEMLVNKGAKVMIRIPVIPGVSDNTEYMNRLKVFLMEENKSAIKEINLLPYHKTGTAKYRRFKMENRMVGENQIPVLKMNEFKEIMSSTGIRVKIGG
jgi:pyruvate formate lyase activating enzyme